MRQKCGFNVPVVISILALIVAVWSQYNAGRSADAAEDARDAVRLELRAWLGYREITLAARRGTDGSWEDREPMQGDYGPFSPLLVEGAISRQELSNPLRLQLCKTNYSVYGLQLPFSKTLYA